MDDILVVSDHTTVIKAVLENLPNLSDSPNLKNIKMRGEKPNGRDILEALITQDIPEDVKNVIRKVLNIRYKTDYAENSIPSDVRELLNKILSDIETCNNAQDIINNLRKVDVPLRNTADESAKAYHNGARIIIDRTILIVEHGKDSIYSSESPITRKHGTNVKKLVKVDVKGAIKGGIDGAIAGALGGLIGVLTGAGLGSIAGAILDSSEEAFDQYNNRK